VQIYIWTQILEAIFNIEVDSGGGLQYGGRFLMRIYIWRQILEVIVIVNVIIGILGVGFYYGGGFWRRIAMWKADSGDGLQYEGGFWERISIWRRIPGPTFNMGGDFFLRGEDFFCLKEQNLLFCVVVVLQQEENLHEYI
jgi:hypothetical protein